MNIFTLLLICAAVCAVILFLGTWLYFVFIGGYIKANMNCRLSPKAKTARYLGLRWYTEGIDKATNKITLKR